MFSMIVVEGVKHRKSHLSFTYVVGCLLSPECVPQSEIQQVIGGDLLLRKNRSGWKEGSQVREEFRQGIGCGTHMVIQDFAGERTPVDAESLIL